MDWELSHHNDMQLLYDLYKDDEEAIKWYENKIKSEEDVCLEKQSVKKPV